MLNIISIALNSMPWIGAQFVEFNRLQIPWTWVICEGASMPVKDTRWMRKQKPRLSTDGTHEFLVDLATHHPNIILLAQPKWEGKTEQLNIGLQRLKQPGLLLQADTDEIWRADQLNRLVHLFKEHPEKTHAQVAMRYFLGPNIISTSGDGYGNRRDEWVRAWRYQPGWIFDIHEPPVFHGNRGEMFTKAETREAIGEVDHYAWATTAQAFQKSRLYGERYEQAVEQWGELQKADMPVADLRTLLPWVGENASCRDLY